MNISNEAILALKKQLSADDISNKIIRFFGTEGCCGPSVQMAMIDQKLEKDDNFTIEGINFSVDPTVKEILEPVTLNFSEEGFKLDGFKSSGCC